MPQLGTVLIVGEELVANMKRAANDDNAGERPAAVGASARRVFEVDAARPAALEARIEAAFDFPLIGSISGKHMASGIVANDTAGKLEGLSRPQACRVVGRGILEVQLQHEVSFETVWS